MNSLKESAKRKDIGMRCELCSRSPQRGFTLLEVLVAITIFLGLYPAPIYDMMYQVATDLVTNVLPPGGIS